MCSVLGLSMTKVRRLWAAAYEPAMENTGHPVSRFQDILARSCPRRRVRHDLKQKQTNRHPSLKSQKINHKNDVRF